MSFVYGHFVNQMFWMVYVLFYHVSLLPLFCLTIVSATHFEVKGYVSFNKFEEIVKLYTYI